MQSDNSINCKAGSGQPFAPPAAAVLHRSFSNMRQIGLSLVSNLAPTVTTRCGAGYLTNYIGGAHYPILGILVIDEVNPDKLSQRLLPHADEPRL